MKTTQRSSYRRGRYRRARLALLLVGAVLTAALAVAAGLLLRQNNLASSGIEAQNAQPSDFSSRYKRHLSQLYAKNGDKMYWKIRELIEYDLYLSIEKGDNDEKIAARLNANLKYYRRRSTNMLDAIYQRMIEKRGNWKYDPNFSEKKNRIDKYLVEHTGLSYVPEGEKTPRGAIEMLVEGMDDLTAAKYLLDPYSFQEAGGEYWDRDESEYAAEYAERVLAEDPSSRDALIVKMDAGVDAIETARLLIKHHPTDEEAVMIATNRFYREYPEEAIAAIVRILPEDGQHSHSSFHMTLGIAYERLDMLYDAADQYHKAYAVGRLMAEGRYSTLERGERSVSSILEERAAASAKQAPAVDPESKPDLEAEMSAAYANFSKAYQRAFEMEYALSEATPEGYMNALLGMARAFAKAGDAQHAQDAYNAVRKRHSREEVEQVFRRFDEQERLKRQPPNDEEDDSGDD